MLGAMNGKARPKAPHPERRCPGFAPLSSTNSSLSAGTTPVASATTVPLYP